MAAAGVAAAFFVVRRVAAGFDAAVELSGAATFFAARRRGAGTASGPGVSAMPDIVDAPERFRVQTSVTAGTRGDERAFAPLRAETR